MSDKEFYKILENFDNLESATDRLTEYDSNAECYDCGSTISGHHTRLCDLAGPNAIRDLPSKRPDSAHWSGEVPRGLEDQVGTWNNTDVPDIDESQTKVQNMGNNEELVAYFNDNQNRLTAELFNGDNVVVTNNKTGAETYRGSIDRIVQYNDMLARGDIEESQTKVQNMGNKVRVTTDGNSTEFDDAETAAAFMGTDDDDNQFATESKESDEEDDFVPNADSGSKYVPSEYDADESKEKVNEGGIYGDMYDADLVRDIHQQFPDDAVSDIRAWMASAEEYDQPLTAEEYGEYRTLGDNVFGDWFNDDNPDDLLYDPATNKDFPRDEEVTEDKTEFATFDSENESHRKRLQRGTPVVLDPELFTDASVNRRGVFVSRSPSGHYGTVVRDLDGKTINVHLSDIKSADLVNNSVYEEFDLNFENMLAEDEDTEKKEKWGVFSKGGSIGGPKNNKPIKTFNNRPDAMADAKFRRKGLSKGEKSYYGMGYSVKKINEDTNTKIEKDIKGLELSLKASNLTANDKKIIRNKIKTKKKQLDEDITMTQTTNMENPENDTTTVTAVGPDAGDELAAMMANAGLNTGEYASMDAPPIDAGPEEVDTGDVEPVEMPMGDMMNMMDENEDDWGDIKTARVGDRLIPGRRDSESYGDDPEGLANRQKVRDRLAGDDDPEVQEAFGEMDPAEKIGHEVDDMPFDWNDEPSDADLDAIDSDPEWDLDFDMDESIIREDDIAYLTNEIAQAIVDGADIYELIHDESVPQKDREGLQRDIDELMLGGDDELTAYDNLAQRIYDMYADADMTEERDIEHANTPGEEEAGVDMVTRGTSGGLNRPKRMYKPAGNRHGDNAMQRPMDDVEENRMPPPTMNYDFDEIDPSVNAKSYSRSNARRKKAGPEGDYNREMGFKDAELERTRSGRFQKMEDEFNEELSPKMQKRKEADFAKAKADRDWSSSSKDSRLRGKGRGTGRADKSVKFGLGEDGGESPAEIAADLLAKVERNENNVRSKMADSPEPVRTLMYTLLPNAREIDGTKAYHDIVDHMEATWSGDPLQVTIPENKFVNEHESVDSFLNMYKEFKIRTDKK